MDHRLLAVVVGVLLVICVPLVAGAQITSGGNGNWSEGTTWVGGIAPTSADDVVIDAGDTVTVHDYNAVGNSISFTDSSAQIKMAANSRLTVYGDFTLASTTHCVFDEQWSATDAKIVFAGPAVQTLSGWSTTGGSTSFRDMVIDKTGGKVTTGSNNMRLGIQNSLEIVNGIFELAPQDDIEGRWATSGFYTDQNKPDVIIRSGGEFDMIDGTGAHHVRSGTDTLGNHTPTGVWTVYGQVRFKDASTIKINLTGVNVEDGGKVITSTGNSGGQLEFGPIHVKAGGEVENYTTSDIYGSTVVFTLDEGGLFDTKSSSTIFPAVFINNGTVRYSRDDETDPELDQVIVDMDYPNLEISLDSDNYKIWTLGANRSIGNQLEVSSDGNLVLTAAAPQSLMVNGTLRLTTGVLDNSDPNVSLTMADGTTISRATGTIINAPAFAGMVDVLYTSTIAPVTTGPELPVPGNVLSNLTVSSDQGVTLGADVTVNGACTISGSDLTTGSYTVTLGGTGTLAEAESLTVVGNVTTTRTASQSVNETFGGIGFEINAAGAAPGATTVLRVTAQPQDIGGSQGIERYFDVSPTNNAGLNATVVVHYDHSELNGIAEGGLVHYASFDGGTNWRCYAGVVDDVANTVTSPGIDSFAIETLAQNTAGADEVAVGTPDVTRLVSAYPNPFTSATRVAFELADRTAVTIGIYDIRGRRVRTLADGVMNGSRHDLIWRGENEAGERLAAGIYFCQMKAGDVVQVQKVVFSK
jgi:hypothetical protein